MSQHKSVAPERGPEPTDAALRADIRRLGTQLGNTLVRQHGPDLLDAVERVRTLTRHLREQGTDEAVTTELHELFDDTDLAHAILLVRAFTVYFHLANVAEQVHRIEDLNSGSPNAAKEGAKKGGPATIGDLFKTQDENSETASGQANDVPAPPEGSTVQSLLEAAEMDENAGKLAKALTAYKQAQVLDASCAKCQSRINRISAEIQERISANLSDAQEYYGSFQFREAIGSWETVLQYIDDPDDPVRKQVEDQLEIARKQLKSQY